MNIDDFRFRVNEDAICLLRAEEPETGRCANCKAYVAPGYLEAGVCRSRASCMRRVAVADSIDRLVNQEGAPEDAFSREVGRKMKPPEPEA